MSSDSRFLTLVLRHRPDQIGIDLDRNGWANVTELLRAMKRHKRPLSRAQLEAIVVEDEKQRFTLSSDGARVRAAQGHSIALDLGLTAAVPPDTLFHGTARHHLNAIFAEGLRPQRRQFVHLSRDVETARIVGARHGKAVVLTVDCAAMVAAEQTFLLSENGIWMTTAVPPRFLGFAPL